MQVLVVSFKKLFVKELGHIVCPSPFPCVYVTVPFSSADYESRPCSQSDGRELRENSPGVNCFLLSQVRKQGHISNLQQSNTQHIRLCNGHNLGIRLTKFYLTEHTVDILAVVNGKRHLQRNIYHILNRWQSRQDGSTPDVTFSIDCREPYKPNIQFELIVRSLR